MLIIDCCSATWMLNSEAENNLSSFLMSHYARNYAKRGEMY